MILGIIITILIGALAGFLAGKIMKGESNSFWVNVFIGIAGGFIGGLLIHKSGIVWQIITGTVGAVILLWIVSLFKKK